jgi:hypothetical protein
MSDTKTKPAPAAGAKAIQFATPNLFSLSGGGLHVEYSTSSFDGQPHLTYQDSLRTLSFIGDQIRVVNVADLGTMVSVTIVLTVDTGGTTFSLLLPPVNLPGPFASVPVSTDGITTHHAFSIIPAFNHGQRDFYSVTPLQGTATQVVF